MNKRHVLWSAFAATLALAACGGGSDSAETTSPSPTPAAPAIDRIEPLDTATKLLAASQAAPAASRLPAGAAVPRVALGALAGAKTATQADKGVALKIGEGRAVAATASPAGLAAKLRWSKLEGGAQVAALAFSAEGAQALRLGVLVQQLPDGAVLRFYGASGSPVVEMSAAELQALRQRNEAGGLAGDTARMVWGPDTEGAVSTLEVQLPAGADAGQLQLAVPRLSHLTQTVKDAAQIGDAASCNLDVMCSADLQAESRSVAKMLFTEADGTYICTGTLLNDTRGSLTPYFLTANHCISTQAAASTLVTYWFFRAASCNGSPEVDPAMARVTGGAQLLYSDSSVDATLLRLNSQPPANVVYAGSYFGDGAVTGVGVAGVHHPRGDLQKYSVGTIAGYANCGDSSCSSASVDGGNMLQIGWTTGTTEGGSSGSAIFASAGGSALYVVGTLTGGSASCENPSGADFYGRFNRAFYRGANTWLTQ
ncbi:trypsin-like peptidase domain-containing protein [Ottowia sp.]|uniref:trypsin-like peptidase domain-containing protein n=1 Tax=Ottowia sp. TaxID=1898956 RepID=UPI0039E5CFDB